MQANVIYEVQSSRMDKTNRCDIAVIGGGPAGTTAATLLSRRGWNVVLFERDVHPRFHIGESLLPMNVPIFEELGILDDIRQIGVVKPGADFTPPNESGNYQIFRFSRALRASPDYAFQVRRSEFDQLLFETCRKAGVDTRERCCVTRVELSDGGWHIIHTRDADEQEQTWECGYVLDASGQQTVLAAQQKWRVRNPQHAAAAIFSHFEDVEFRPADESGNISLYWFDAGWIWMIPLPDGIMSVGAVCRPEHLKTRQGSKKEFLIDTVNRSVGARNRFRNARQVQPTRVVANYSYFSKKQVGPGFALIGDAYAFIDPIFSSGVYLAMSSATQIVPVVEHWLNEETGLYGTAARRYRRSINRGIDTFSWFIYRFTTPTMVSLFRKPRNIFKVEQAVISMLAGDVYKGGEIRFRLLVFKCIFAIASLIHALRPKHQPSVPAA